MTQNLGSTSNPLSMTGEQWVLEERTDDPATPDDGECWIRSDLNAGDKIATLKFGDGSEVPIFPTGTSEPGVLEVRRVQTGGQTGYLPVAEPDESRFPQFRLQHNNTVYGLHNNIAPGVIPDSEGTHEWLFDEASGPTAADRVGNADMSLTGTWVTGEGVGDAVFDCTGDNDLATASEADLTDWGDAGAILLPFHIETVTTSDQTFWWSVVSNRMYSRISGDSQMHIGLADTANDTGHGIVPSNINTGEWNGWGLSWDSGNYDVVLYDYVNETSTTGSGTYSGTVSKDDDLDVGGRSDSDDPIDGKFDFPRVYGNSLSQSEMISRFEELSGFYP